MGRITVLLIFSTLIIVVLNLKSGQNLKVEKKFFNLDNYEKSYDAEQTLISELTAPKVEEKKIVEEELKSSSQ